MSKLVFVFCWFYCGTLLSEAQELSPRAFWPFPRGTKVAVFGYSYVWGETLMDPSIPMSGVNSKINTGFLAYMHNFSFFGRTTNVVVELPYNWGLMKGYLVNDPAQKNISGFSDLGITLAANLLGGPSMTPGEFQELRNNPHILLGASLKVVVPTGQYYKNKLINVGANRWAFRTKIGTLITLNAKWSVKIESGLWWFTRDDDFIMGTREQKPIFSGEIHLVKRFKPGLWMSVEANFYTGGRQIIGGDQLIDIQRNSKIGTTVVAPFLKRHSVKLGYSKSIITKYGADFDQLLITYQVLLNKL